MSYVVVAISRLFQHHPGLLLRFEAFVPANYSPAAAVAADSLDFLDRVSELFSTDNNGVYREFLDSMASYSEGEYTVSQVREKVVGLFGENYPDLTAELMSFLPKLELETESELGSESSNVKSSADNDFGGKQIRVPARRNRGKGGGGDDDKVTGPSPKKVKINFELEDSLCYVDGYVDVQISRLGSTYETAVKIARRIIDGSL